MKLHPNQIVDLVSQLLLIQHTLNGIIDNLTRYQASSSKRQE